MANVALNIIMGLVNKSIPGLQATEQQLREIKAQAKQVRSEFQESWGSIASTSQATGAALLGISAGLGVVGKSALDASMQMEGFRAKMQVAMKDNAKAEDMMDWAKDFEASTPFEIDEVVDATTRLQLYGLEAKHWLPLVGDMAGAMGRDVTDGVEAIADAVSGGGLERLKEFGISSQKLKAAGWTGSYQTTEGVDSLKKALESIMATDFKGGMDKLADTTAGKISNLNSAVFNLRSALGDALAPTIQTVAVNLGNLTGLIEKLTTDHPALTQAIVYGGIALFLFGAAIGPLLILLPGLVEAYNLLKLAQEAGTIASVRAKVAQYAAAVSTRISGMAATAASGGWWAMAAGEVAALWPLAAIGAAILSVAASFENVNRLLKEGSTLWEAIGQNWIENLVPLNTLYKIMVKVADLFGMDTSKLSRNWWGSFADDDAFQFADDDTRKERVAKRGTKTILPAEKTTVVAPKAGAARTEHRVQIDHSFSGSDVDGAKIASDPRVQQQMQQAAADVFGRITQDARFGYAGAR